MGTENVVLYPVFVFRCAAAGQYVLEGEVDHILVGTGSARHKRRVHGGRSARLVHQWDHFCHEAFSIRQGGNLIENGERIISVNARGAFFLGAHVFGAQLGR